MGARIATPNAARENTNATLAKIFDGTSGQPVAPIYPASTAVTTHSTGARRATVAGRGGGGSGAASGIARLIQEKFTMLPIIFFGTSPLSALPWLRLPHN
jgi:hypothetical protein